MLHLVDQTIMDGHEQEQETLIEKLLPTLSNKMRWKDVFVHEQHKYTAEMETPNKPAQSVRAGSTPKQSPGVISSRRNELDGLYAAQQELAGDSEALRHIQALQVQSVTRQEAFTALDWLEKSTSANSFDGGSDIS
jgi:hypothetical protein